MKIILKELSDQELFNYFIKHARYHNDAPLNTRYSIRTSKSGGIALFAEDTDVLLDKFIKKVREC